jgi:hypothetical protein
MKIQSVKQEVFSLTYTSNTTQLKKERPDLTEGKDLRYKIQWIEILKQLKALRTQVLDISLVDLEQSEKMLKESLFKIGHLANLNNERIETDWQRIKLEAQFSDIHIENL